MATVTKFTVVPRLPKAIEHLKDIAYNLYWCWNPEAVDLFFRMNRDLWVKTNQNPVRLLGAIGQERLEELAQEESFRAHLERVWNDFSEYMAANPWKERHRGAPADLCVAYLSAEFGVHESVSIYSGGLGVLAGDHLKSASDLAIPLVAVGLLYREGYHSQYLNADGWQQERYPRNDFYNMAITPVVDEKGEEVIVSAEFPGRQVYVRAWKCQVGRIPLYLLDCDFSRNEGDDREITARLYGGDRDMRVRQEIILGMGGVRLLRALGYSPTVYHMNEGHAAFMVLERVQQLVHTEQLTIAQAVEAVKSSSVFTTHTPVPAGNDMFAPEMIEHYFASFAQDMGITMDQLLAWGRQQAHDGREPFSMTVLALRLSAAANGVSKLHGNVARQMWSNSWPGIPEDEVPITSITNGVHPRSWVSRDLAGLYDRYLGPGWVLNPADQKVWDRIREVPDAELWRTHERRRERLVNFARRRLVAQLQHRAAPSSEVRAAMESLDPETLTIAFARRFATYKRANLFMYDPERLVRLLTNPERPVQMIIAGKAHPADNSGKDLIRNIVQFIRRFDMRNHVIFIEDYDMNVARYMVQGVDCWLNTPRRPMEASGTSGMKAAANGVLNISIPDGWWCEAEELGENGWSIGRGESYTNNEEQDIAESQLLYELLEREVIPAFYERGRDGLPREWIRRMKTAIHTIVPVFNTHRMVDEYASRFYLPCTVRRTELRDKNRKRANSLAEWKSRIHQAWSKVRIVNVKCGERHDLPYGSKLEVSADVSLTDATDKDVVVEIYYGDIGIEGQIKKGKALKMDFVERLQDGVFRFKGAILCDQTGQQGFTVRVIPSHPDLMDKHETALITWA